MPERDSGQEDHFNLLPFIAILLCVLGTELLVTMSMATISLGVGAVEGWVQDKDPAHATKNPTLIEWDGKTATVQRQDQDEKFPLALDSKTPPPGFAHVIDELAS